MMAHPRPLIPRRGVGDGRGGGGSASEGGVFADHKEVQSAPDGYGQDLSESARANRGGVPLGTAGGPGDQPMMDKVTIDKIKLK
jgi:hypothetical protein